jgi:hypothetical protein
MGTSYTKRYVTTVELTEVGVEVMKRDNTRDQNHGRDEEIIYSRDLNRLAELDDLFSLSIVRLW